MTECTSAPPRATDTIHAKDVLVLYGLIERLQELDQRTAAAGESAHQDAVTEHVTQSAEQETPQKESKPAESKHSEP